MPPRNDDVNVFKIPHGRMLQLVNTCNKNLTVTDFANNDELFALLNNMQSVFIEFKSHEEIENEHIMKKLKSKLQALAIHNSAVCNCHKTDVFTPLFQLVDLGYLHINKTKTTSERINFGVRFRKELSQFTQRFLPHMKQEEEEFQPLLMKYFSEDELVEMKNIVIKSHIQKRKESSPSLFNRTNSNNNNSTGAKPSVETLHLDKQLTHIYSPMVPASKISNTMPAVNLNILDLPNELLIKIFSNLSIRDRLKVACVSKSWYQLIYDKGYWKSLNFSEWKQTFKPEALEQISSNNLNEEQYNSEDDAEMKIIHYWIKILLPKVGAFITDLDVHNCRVLNNNLMRRILQLCPNLKKLDISFTRIGGNAFRGVSLEQMEHLNCEGCQYLSDEAFKYLLLSTSHAEVDHNHCLMNLLNNINTAKCSHHCLNRNICTDFENESEHENFEEMFKHKQESTSSTSINRSLNLKYINLSGCWLITDFGLGCIASKYDLTNLEYLNLSGCINLSSIGMSLFVNMSKSLNGSNLYYCDNFTDGPMSDTANSCDNYCGDKFCCRSSYVN